MRRIAVTVNGERIEEEVEPGRAADACDLRLSDALLPERGQDDGRAAGARDERDVAGREGERLGERLLVPPAHGRDHDRVRAVTRFLRDAPPDRAGQLAQRARRGRVADHREERAGQVRLDEHLDDALGGAVALGADDVLPRPGVRPGRADPHEPRRPLRHGAQRLPDDDRLGAGAADPADERPVGGDEPAVAAVRRGRPPHAHDGRERERLPRLLEPRGFSQDLGHSASPTSFRACQTRSGVTGISRLRTPACWSASTTAFT